MSETSVREPASDLRPGGKGSSLVSIKFAAAFGQITLMLMRTPQHRHSFLGDLEWLVIPAIATNQFLIAEHRDQGSDVTYPLATVLWARVNEEVDARLCAHPEQRIRLKPDEWACGEIPWLVEAAGEPRMLGGLLRELIERRFPDRDIKSIGRGPDGKPCVRLLKRATGTPGANDQTVQAEELAAASR
jgi:cytolysin-activating lysine-acyltransferase